MREKAKWLVNPNSSRRKKGVFIVQGRKLAV
jgi:hypothetical protein